MTLRVEGINEVFDENHTFVKGKCKEVFEKVMNLIPWENKRHLFAREAFIAGGAIASLCLREEPNDYDFFFKTEGTAKDFYNTVIQSVVLDSLDIAKEKIFSTKNAISFNLKSGEKIQFIIAKHGDPYKVVNEFDFDHCKNYYCYNKSCMLLNFSDNNKKPIEMSGILMFLHYNSIITKKLEISNKLVNPFGCMLRLRKFIKRGYEIDNMNMAKIYNEILRTVDSDISLEEYYETGKNIEEDD